MKPSKLKFILPDSSAFNISTPTNLPKMHFVMLAIGKRGSGKTVAIVNYLKYLQDSGCLDRLFIISPSVYSNKHILDLVKFEEEDVYEEPTKKAIDDIIEKINIEAQEYEIYHEKLKAYKKFMKHKDNGKFKLTDHEILSIFGDENFEKPKHKYNGKKPVMVALLDDCQNSEIYRPRSNLSSLVIKHRHLGQLKESGGALGLSFIFAVQSYTSLGGGLPRAIRQQATLIFLFRTKDSKELAQISAECSGEISPEMFLKVYEIATAETHNFLLIDFHPKEKQYEFRQNFNTLLVVNNESNIEKKSI
jgi:hypothetical protein